MVIAPKAARVAKVIELAVVALRTGNLGIKEASTLQGVLRFLREGLFGRVGGRLLNSLGNHERTAATKFLSRELKEALEWLVCCLPIIPPRSIRVTSIDNIVHVFTDGASEPNRATVGGCIFERGLRPEVFGSVVPAATVTRWTAGRKTQVIGQAELHYLLPIYGQQGCKAVLLSGGWARTLLARP